MKTLLNKLSLNWVSFGVLGVAVVLAFNIGLMMPAGNSKHDHEASLAQADEKKPTRWTCAMHPQINLPNNDQKCPICFMELVPIDDNFLGDGQPTGLVLSESAAALADVASELVMRKYVTTDVHLVGKVTSDETMTRTITARVGGRLEKLYVEYTGQVVARGMSLAEIYSPELYTAQVELQSAARAAKSDHENGVLAGRAAQNLQAVSERLRLWGMSEGQIEEIIESQTVSHTMTIAAPIGGTVITRNVTRGDYIKTGSVLYEIADLSRVWIALEAFEVDVALLSPGQSVRFTTRAYPGTEFVGNILFVNSVLNENTRTIEVRVVVENMDGKLKPGMLVTAEVAVRLDESGQPVLDEREAVAPLVIPASAPLLTGDRAVVYVKSESEEGLVFSGREIQLGPRVGEYYIVLSGLQEGELVVTRGNFKIDSALQIQAQPSMMNPKAELAETPMNMLMPTERETDLETGVIAVPDCFADDLERVVTRYYQLQAALASDDDGAAREAATQVTHALHGQSCDVTELGATHGQLWTQTTQDLLAAAELTVKADNISERRARFEPLSDQLWLAVMTFQGSATSDVKRFHCPMAMNGAGAFWLQASTETANPYYGSAMLRCGSQVASVANLESGE